MSSFKLLYPKALSIIFLLTISVPFTISGDNSFFPLIDLILIFYWSIYCPKLIPNWFVFLLGAIKDLISGAPIGVNMLLNLLTRFVLRSSRGEIIHANFIVIWQLFFITLLLVMILKWAMLSIIAGEKLGIGFAHIQFALTVAVYPIFHYFFNMVFETIPKNFRENA